MIFRFVLLNAIICALAVTGISEAAGPAAKIVVVSGTVKILSPPKTLWQDAHNGSLIKPGEVIKTGESGKASVLMADETLIKLNRNTQLKIKQMSASAGWHHLVNITKKSLIKSLYQLNRGEIWLLNKNKKANIEIETATVSAAIRGTEFDIKIEPDSAVRVSVLEGKVKVWNDFGAATVSGGEEAFTEPGFAPFKRLLLNPADAVQWTIIVPNLFRSRDIPLVSKDFNYLINQEKRLRSLSNSLPETAANMAKLAFILRDLNRQPEAVRILQKIAAEQEDNEDVKIGLAWCRLDQGKTQEALHLFQQITRESVNSYLGRILVLAQLKRFKDAASITKTAKINFPDSPKLLLAEAWLKILTGQITAANKIISTATGKDATLAVAWQLNALSLLILDHYDEASKAVVLAQQLSPDSPIHFLLESYIQQAQFDLPGAKKSIMRALSLDPENITALTILAKLQFGSGFIDSARKSIDKAYKLAPNVSEVNDLRGFILLSQRQGNPAKAFNKAISLNHSIATPHLGLGLLKMRQGDSDSALEEITTAVLLAPRRSLLRSYWAKILYQIGRRQKALDVLDIAKNIDPLDPTPDLYRAFVLRDLNRPTDAVAALNKAISLNNNKAVYRSRFLLDQDAAVKNISLALVFKQLGLENWSQKKAITSVKDDYANSAAHLFYADSFTNDEDRTWIRGSEYLLARLLQPANVNTFNTFNQYTSLLEKPATNFGFTVEAGNNSFRNGEFAVFGAVPRYNIAYQAAYVTSRTDGWRTTNHQATDISAGYLKWDLSFHDSLMLAALKSNSNEKDNAYPKYEFDTIPEPQNRTDGDVKSLELGYHHNFAPGADILFHYTNSINSTDYQLYSYLNTNLFNSNFSGKLLTTDAVKQNYNQYQGEFIKRIGRHQLIGGAVHYLGTEADNRLVDGDILVTPPGILVAYSDFLSILYNLNNHIISDQSRRSHTWFIEDIWQYSSSIRLEGAIFHDTMDLGEVHSTFWQNQWHLEEINPRIGFVWNMSQHNTIRSAIFRYIQPFVSDRIAPADIAGIPVFRNTIPGSINKESNLAWEYEWDKGFFSMGGYYLEQEYTIDNGIIAINFDGRTKGMKISLDTIIRDGIGFNITYDYQKKDQDMSATYNREDHLLTSGFDMVSANGLSFGIDETFRYVDFLGTDRPGETIWITDISIKHEFLNKLGFIKIVAKNIFDQQFNWVTDVLSDSGRNPGMKLTVTLDCTF